MNGLGGEVVTIACGCIVRPGHVVLLTTPNEMAESALRLTAEKLPERANTKYSRSAPGKPGFRNYVLPLRPESRRIIPLRVLVHFRPFSVQRYNPASKVESTPNRSRQSKSTLAYSWFYISPGRKDTEPRSVIPAGQLRA